MMKNKVLLVLIFANVLGAAGAQTTLNVPSGAYPTIQSAINAAMNGDVVRVAAGTFVENIDFLGKSIRVQGQGPGLSIIDGGQQDSVVKFQTMEDVNTILDGFTITNGLGPMGGGILFAGTISPQGALQTIFATVSNCVITNNRASLGAGIGCASFAAPVIKDCVISNNTPIQTLGGCGVYATQNSIVTITGCAIRDNVGSTGAGLAGAAYIVEDSLIEGNMALNGGMGRGGGMHAVASLDRCVIRNNFAEDWGGGILRSLGTITNCYITGNRARFGGGLHHFQGPGPNLVHTTLSDNTATMQGGGIWINGASSPLTLTNSILWGNVPDGIFDATPPPFPQAWAASFSDVQGGVPPGNGNIDADPRFVDPMHDDHRIRGDSPCVDAGDATVGNLPMTDFEGDPRSLYTTVDMGADEMADVSLDPSASGNVGGMLGPVNLLFVDGMSGGASRRVLVGVGQPFSVSVLQPPTSNVPSHFAIFGMLRMARHDDPFVLPFGIGTMSFKPCTALPSAFPTLFTLTNNGILGPCNQLFPSTPTPWTSPPGSISIPIELTLQGVIEETPGVLRVTNAVILKIS